MPAARKPLTPEALHGRYDTDNARRYNAGYQIGLSPGATWPTATDHPAWVLGFNTARERLELGQRGFFQKYGLH